MKLRLVTDKAHSNYTRLENENGELISRYITDITWHCSAPGTSTVTVVIENVETHLEGEFSVAEVTKTTTTYKTKDEEKPTSFDRVRAKEREECAKIAEQYEKEWEGQSYGSMRECANLIAVRIRDRG